MGYHKTMFFKKKNKTKGLTMAHEMRVKTWKTNI
jgi:hypothetical protein